MKNEARILISKEFTLGCVDDRLTLYFVIRGIKGLEHVGLVKGSSTDLLKELTERGILDEVRITLNDDVMKAANFKSSISQAISEGHLIMNKIVLELNKLICRNYTS